MKINNINNKEIKLFEKKLLNEEFDSLERLIEELDKENFNHPAIKFIYANSKSLKKNSTLNDKKIAFNIFIDICKSNPQFKQALYNACALCFEVREYSKILNLIKKFIEKNYYDKIIEDTLYKIYGKLGDVENTVLQLKKIINIEPNNLKAWSALLFCINYLEEYSQEEYLKYSKLFSKNILNNHNENKKFLYNNKRIKLGFITPAFSGNAIDGFLKGFLENIDKNTFQTVSFNLNVSDLKTDHHKTYFDDWNHVYKLNDNDLIKFIKNKKIDIMIDLIGHGPGNRLSILKSRVAPIQMLWLGYCNSTGLNEVDYIVVDKHLIKPSENHLYSEKILYLDKIWNSHTKMNEELIVNDLPFYKNKYFTYGSFNNFKKMSMSTINAWSEILRQTNSKLILKSSMHNDKNLREEILNKFPKKIVDNKQIELLEGQRSKLEHLKTYNQIDLGLDTFPYNGVTTSFEAIWMGVPILTIKGKNFISRTGESINKNMGLEKFVAKNKDEYIEKAIEFSKNTSELRELRKILRNKSLNSPLFKTKEFADDFGKKLQLIVKKG